MDMKEFLELLPKHQGDLSLTHNPHRSFYETVESYEKWRELGADDWVSSEQRAKAIKAQDFWEMQWYPDTPIGFHIRLAHDLVELLQDERMGNP